MKNNAHGAEYLVDALCTLPRVIVSQSSQDARSHSFQPTELDRQADWKLARLTFSHQ